MRGESTTDLDRKRKELGKDSKRSAEAISSGGPQGDIGPADELFRQGEDLCRRGLYEEAIHVWTRILFLERADTRAKGAIEGAKRAVSERQRELDVELAVAEELLASGDIDGAASGVDHILSRDPRHAEGHQLAERIAARQRRPDVTPANVGAVAVHENDNVDESLSLSKRGLRLRVSHEASPRLTPSSLKMGGFALGVILVFASGALYLHLNWESIVSDGAFVTVTGVTGAALAPGGAGPVDAIVPGASELRYYNGARLFAKGRYREALAELSLVGRDDAVSERARSLILRIEDRLLRGGELDHEQPSKAVR